MLSGARDDLAVVGRHLQILLGRLARARPLEIGFADVEDRVGREAVAGVGGHERLEPVFGLLELAGLEGLQRGVVLFPGNVEHRHAGADDRRPGRERGRRRRALAEFERRSGRRRRRRTSGALGAVVPSGCGAPGAFGSAFGSKASDFLGLTVTGASITVTGGTAAAGGVTATGAEATEGGEARALRRIARRSDIRRPGGTSGIDPRGDGWRSPAARCGRSPGAAPPRAG